VAARKGVIIPVLKKSADAKSRAADLRRCATASRFNDTCMILAYHIRPDFAKLPDELNRFAESPSRFPYHDKQQVKQQFRVIEIAPKAIA
jgi:hypothetical protein